MTCVCVLPLHDMSVFAGQLIQTDILYEECLLVGVGRGAFADEMARIGKPIEESREEVSWNGKCYEFPPLTVMPRPPAKTPPTLMVAALVPEAIEASVRRGLHTQATPLDATVARMKEQVAAFMRGKASLGAAGLKVTSRTGPFATCCRSRAWRNFATTSSSARPAR